MEQLQQLAQIPASSETSCGDHSNVYVRGLPMNADENFLASLFQPYGEIQSIRVFNSGQQNSSKLPFAFVKLNSVEKAEAAIASLNGANIAGNVLEVRLADHDAMISDRNPPPSDNIYCKNLPASFGDNELKQIFSLFGVVTMCRVFHQGDATGQGGAALVRFSSMADAARAVQALQGHRLLGSLHPLIVRFADSMEMKAKKQAKQMAGGASGGIPTHHQQHDTSGQSASQHRRQVQAYGSMQSPASTTYPGFFASPSASYRGGFQGMQHDPSCNPNYPMPSHIGLALGNPSISNIPFGSGLPDAAPPVAVASLYVKNLPLDADKLFLYEKFAPFGAILSIKILTDEQGASKGVGFVNFSDPVCAGKAAAALHNLPIGTRNLHVAFQTHRKA